MMRTARQTVRRARPAFPARSAFALIEMLVAIAVGGILLTMGITIIHLLLHSEQKVTQDARFNRSLSRLSREFTDDVRRALSADIVRDPKSSNNSLVLHMPEKVSVTYSVQGERALRVEKSAESLRGQNEFHFAPQTTLEFSMPAATRQPPQREVRLAVLRPTNSATSSRDDSLNALHGAKSPQPARRLELSATLGRDLRFAGANP